MADLKPIRNSFNSGELSPKLDFRGDLTKYHSGCKTLQNAIPLVEGGAARSPGTYFVKEVKTSAKATRVVDFQYKDEQAYILEFGDLYIRFYKDKDQIAATEIVTPYLEADLFELKFNPSTDTLYIDHPDYAQRKLTRTSHTDWTLTTITYKPSSTREFGHDPDTTLTPGATTGAAVTFTAGASSFLNGDVGRIISYGTARATIVIYVSPTVVTCDIIDDFPDTDPIVSGDWKIEGSPIGTLEPSRKDRGSLSTLVSGGINANPRTLNMSFDSWVRSTATGELVYYWGASIATGEYYFVAPPPPVTDAAFRTEPDQVYVNGVAYTKGVVGSLTAGKWGWGDNDALGYNTVYVRLPGDVNADNVANIQSLIGVPKEIFRTEDVGKFVLINSGVIKIIEIKSATIVTGEVISELESVSAGPWTLEEPVWNATLGFPSAGYFYEQRLVLASIDNINLSVSDDYENFTVDPVRDDATISYRLVANKSERINWFSGTDFLLVGTYSSLWKVSATNVNEPISQTNISAKKISGLGTKNIEPVYVSDATLWTDTSGRKVKRLDYSLESDKYVPVDLTRFASHITFGATKALSGIVEMAYQQSPVPIVWAIRADGQLLGMTYETQEEVFAWFRIVTDGYFESVAVITKDDEEDQVWVVVRRTIDGSDVRYVEYFTPMELFGQIDDSFFVHSGFTFDGGDAVVITDITQASPPVVSAANTFAGGEKVRIKDVLGMTQVNQGLTKAYTVANPTGINFELSGYTSLGWDAYTSGGQAQVVEKDFTTGLDHLEGETLDIVVDGAVHAQKAVVSGNLSLSYYGNKIHLGLPAPAIIEPTKPYLDTRDGGITRGKQQRIYGAILSFFETYGCKIGKDLDNLETVKFGTGDAPELVTGEKEIPLPGSWGTDAPLVITQDIPLPMTLRALIYELDTE